MGVSDQTQGHWTLTGEMTTAGDGQLGAVSRTTVVEQPTGEESATWSMLLVVRPSGEVEPATDGMLPVERPTGEVLATDVASTVCWA